MVVELIKNPEFFDDVYPSDSDDATDSEEDDELKKTDAEVKVLEDKIDRLKNNCDTQQEIINSNTSSLQILEKMLGKLEFEDVGKISSSLLSYRKQRSEFYEALSRAKIAKVDLGDRISALEKQKIQLENRLRKQDLKDKIKKQKAAEKKQRAVAQSQSEKKRSMIEKAKFWPKKIYKIKLTIESTIMTPGLSRTESFESLATADTVLSAEGSEPVTTTLLLTYIVNGASWIPKYDLSISTINGTGTMNYRAEVQNTTSETWKDAKVILSTSRATFSGVQEPIPVIKPWLLHLEKNVGTFGVPPTEVANPTLSIQEKMNASSNRTKSHEHSPSYSRAALFGVQGKDSDADLFDPHTTAKHDHKLHMLQLEQENKTRLDMHTQKESKARGEVRNSLFGNPSTASAFGSNSVPPPPPRAAAALGGGGGGAPTGALFGSSMPSDQSRRGAPPSANQEGSRVASIFDGAPGSMRLRSKGLDEAENSEEDENETSGENSGGDPSWEETGLTTNLELRGTRTIMPSSSMKRFRIATVRITQIILTHAVVPKLRAEAFLRARITNTSPTALLKGSAGLTLDGTFLGHTTIPRCSSGENFLLPLGIDPAIAVDYPTPIARKNMGSGMFNKEQSVTFTRTILLTNTRNGGGVVTLTVKDQIPVSEDERLKIDILTPKGLQQENDKVQAGVEFVNARTQQRGLDAAEKKASTSKTSGQSWGQAIAKLEKLGAVEWTVTLKAGKAVRLTLEYGIRHPGTEKALEQAKLFTKTSNVFGAA